MSDSQWKDALWNLLDVMRLRRITARVALSAGLLGLATHSVPDAMAQPRVPVSPFLTPEATVRKFKGRYVLRRAASSFVVHLAAHRSHSSHSSHRSHSSHSSHSSSSHYSGAHASHYSSSPSPAPAPTAPRPSPTPEPDRARSATPPTIMQVPKPAPLLRDEFTVTEPMLGVWRIGVLATPEATFDPNIVVGQDRGALRITPVQKPDAHFSGYVSVQSFDLNPITVTVSLRRPASGATTIVAMAIDSENWRGFRIEGGQLSIESHTNGRIAAKTIPYRPSQHRFLRLRMSNVAPVIVWETSGDGVSWNPEYVETVNIAVRALRIALSAGTTKSTPVAGPAEFDSVIVERMP